MTSRRTAKSKSPLDTPGRRKQLASLKKRLRKLKREADEAARLSAGKAPAGR